MNRRATIAAFGILTLSGWLAGEITSRAAIIGHLRDISNVNCNAMPACSNNGVNCFPNENVFFSKPISGTKNVYIGNTQDCAGTDTFGAACTCSYAAVGEI
jgi:hypothetical protein